MGKIPKGGGRGLTQTHSIFFSVFSNSGAYKMEKNSKRMWKFPHNFWPGPLLITTTITSLWSVGRLREWTFGNICCLSLLLSDYHHYLSLPCVWIFVLRNNCWSSLPSPPFQHTAVKRYRTDWYEIWALIDHGIYYVKIELNLRKFSMACSRKRNKVLG